MIHVLFAALLVAAPSSGKNPKVKISTTLGDMVVELDRKAAPVSVDNFLKYVAEKHYDGTVFHRVIKKFMIQGGGFDKDLRPVGKKAHPPIKNEAGNGLKNTTGTVAMARTFVVDSATDQFFINVNDNAFLDHRGETPQGFGYAVFGKLVSGLEVAKKIENVATTSKPNSEGQAMGDVPADAVVIKSIRVVK